MKRTQRLFALAEHLRGRRSGITASALADRFGVTLRTIYRDLDALRDAEFPVHAERGRGGGFAVDRAYSLPPVNFTPREAALLIAAGGFVTRMRMLPFVGTLESALDKVRAALTASAQRELVRHVESLQFIGVPALAPRPGVREAVEQAWFEHAPLQVRYRDAQGIETTRVVDIVSVVMERAETRLNCHDTGRQDARQLRLDRIVSARVVAREVSSPPAR